MIEKSYSFNNSNYLDGKVFTSASHENKNTEYVTNCNKDNYDIVLNKNKSSSTNRSVFNSNPRIQFYRVHRRKIT